MENINKILKKQSEKVNIDDKEFNKIKQVSDDFCKELKKRIKERKINAEVFVGGSLAKNTLVKTDENKYDVDIFVRFDKKYKEEEISDILKKLFWKKPKNIHGSRDYFQIIVDKIILEIIPVIKIKNPSQARNITDLSYFHVNYVLNHIKKNKKLSDEIRLAKAFAHGQDCYGAESYIKGFSGYAIELLIIYYGSFLNFIKSIAKNKSGEKIIIDSENHYKNKKDVLMEMNESKILSPVVLVDPTFKERNALSGLSNETFEKFKKSCIDFLSNPSHEFFIRKKVSDEFKNYKNVKKISIKTSKQAGDIAGTKSKKFFSFLLNQISREFEIKKSGFEYDEDENIAHAYLALDKKSDEIIKGPPIVRVEHLNGFKKVHPDAFIKNGFCYAKVSHEMSFNEFIKRLKDRDKKIIKEMGVSEMKEI